jgi:hypothetical protein
MKKANKSIEDEYVIDPENFAALKEATKMGDERIFEYLMDIPPYVGQKYRLRFKRYGMAGRMEADHGHEGSKSPAFDNKKWCADQCRRLNMALLDVKFVDAKHHREPVYENHEIPLQWLTELDFQILMEKIFPGFSVPAISVKDKADAIPDEAGAGVPSAGDANRSS